jgi:hypothetical protein
MKVTEKWRLLKWYNTTNGLIVRCYSVKNNPSVSIESVSIMGIFAIFCCFLMSFLRLGKSAKSLDVLKSAYISVVVTDEYFGSGSRGFTFPIEIGWESGEDKTSTD